MFVERGYDLRWLSYDLLVPAEICGPGGKGAMKSHIISKVSVEERTIWNTNQDKLQTAAIPIHSSTNTR